MMDQARLRPAAGDRHPWVLQLGQPVHSPSAPESWSATTGASFPASRSRASARPSGSSSSCGFKSTALPKPRSTRSSRRSPTASPTSDSRPNDQNFWTALPVSPPVALAIDVFARSLAEIGRADDEELEALRPGLVASPRTGRDAHRVPFLELDDLVVDLHPPAPAQDHVHLLLLLVRVAVRKAIAGRDALVAQGGFLELERLGRRAELQVRRAVKPRADVLQILLDVPERERHGAILWRHFPNALISGITRSEIHRR